jgi:hypothetical protein
MGKGPDTVQIDQNRDIIRASVKLSWSSTVAFGEHFKQRLGLCSVRTFAGRYLLLMLAGPRQSLLLAATCDML